jgi:hypothetical protein
VPFAEDEHVIGDLAAGGEHESFRVCVGSWASRRDLADGDSGVGQHGVEGGGELPGPITDEDFGDTLLEPAGYPARPERVRTRPVVVSYPSVAAAESIIGVVIGVGVLGARLRGRPVVLAVQIVGLAVITVGVYALVGAVA